MAAKQGCVCAEKMWKSVLYWWRSKEVAEQMLTMGRPEADEKCEKTLERADAMEQEGVDTCPGTQRAWDAEGGLPPTKWQTRQASTAR